MRDHDYDSKIKVRIIIVFILVHKSWVYFIHLDVFSTVQTCGIETTCVKTSPRHNEYHPSLFLWIQP